MFKLLDKRESLSKLVAARIEEAIQQKGLTPGSRLPSEMELCKQFGVSRTSIREAIRMLSAKGLISVKKGKGIFVKAITAESITTPMHLYLQSKSEKNYVLDIVHARQMIEPQIAATAALRRTTEDIERLQRDLASLEECDGEFIQLASLDMEFHIDIARASQNAIMPLVLEPIHRLMPQIKTHVYATVGDAKQSAVIWHRRILSQIVKGDPDSSREAMTAHLRIAEEHAKKMLEAETLSVKVDE
jgi:GntR family transcriptional repressor for pyruvate dehydrogenase complex